MRLASRPFSLGRGGFFLTSPRFRFAVATWYPPDRQIEKVIVTIGYLALAYGSFLPVLPYFSKSYRENGHRGLALFLATHTYWVNWFVSFGIFPVSLFCQWLCMKGQPVPRSLSVEGLAAQSVAFVLTGVSWTWRMTVDKATWAEWYMFVGYAAVDNLLFGVVQGILCLFVCGKTRPVESQDDEDETRPLLPN